MYPVLRATCMYYSIVLYDYIISDKKRNFSAIPMKYAAFNHHDITNYHFNQINRKF